MNELSQALQEFSTHCATIQELSAQKPNAKPVPNAEQRLAGARTALPQLADRIRTHAISVADRSTAVNPLNLIRRYAASETVNTIDELLATLAMNTSAAAA